MMQPTNINYEPAAGYSPFEDEADTGLANASNSQQQSINHNAPISNTPAAPTNAHPVALYPRAGALLTFMLSSLFTSSFVIPFIIAVILVAFDFWTVKNITGRILVGLRWWNEVLEDGTNKWVFESVENKSNINQKEALIFWVSMVGMPVIWAVCILAMFISLKPMWAVIAIIGFVLSGANVAGYWKCSRDAKKRVQTAATGFAIQQFLNRATNV